MKTSPAGVKLNRPYAKNDVFDVSDGGTGASTQVGAARSLGVPTLIGNNVMDGNLEVRGLLQAVGGVEITTDFLNVVDSGGSINVLDFSTASGASFLFGPGGGTVQVVGAEVRVPYNTASGAYSVQATDTVLNCTSGTFSVALPAASGVTGKILMIKNSGAGTITVDPDGAETVDGAASATIAAGAKLWLVCDGSGWISI